MIGLFEKECAPWNVRAIPHDSSFTTIQPDWDRMGQYVEAAMSRVPRSLDTGIRTFFCGPESFTPDLRPIIGPAPEVRNYFVAAGLNSIGILTGGGLGRLVAHWIVDGDPGADVTGMHPARLQPYQANPEYRRTRTVESLGMVYQCHYPNKSLHTARGAKLSPLHARLVQQGAYFRDVSGWESADWYAGPGRDAGGRPTHVGSTLVVGELGGRAPRLPRGRGRDGHELHVEVPGAGSRCRARCSTACRATRSNGAPGEITYTQWLNERGTLEADLTVTKLDDESFFVVATDTAHRHVESQLQRACGDGARLRHRRHRRVRADQRAGAAVARAAADPDHRRSVERSVPVPHRSRDRPRLRTRPVHPHHLPGRARLRAVRAHRAGRARVRPPGRRRAGVRVCATRG